MMTMMVVMVIMMMMAMMMMMVILLLALADCALAWLFLSVWLVFVLISVFTISTP